MTVTCTLPLHSFWIIDCASKGLLAERIAETEFERLDFEYHAKPVDPNFKFFPKHLAVPLGQGYTSTYPPAYSMLAACCYSLVGSPGLRVPAALGVSLSAAFLVVLLVPSIGTAAGVIAGLVLGLATPLLFYGVTVWEHSLVVALFLGSCICIDQRSKLRASIAGLLMAVACCFREDALLLFASMAIVLIAVRSMRPVALAFLLAGALPLAALVVTYATIYGELLGPHLIPEIHLSRTSATPGQRSNPLFVLLAGVGATPKEQWAFLIVFAAMLALGLVSSRRKSLQAMAAVVAVLVGTGLWGFATWKTLTSSSPLWELLRFNGMLFRVPLSCFIGLGVASLSRGENERRLRLTVAASLLFAASIIAFEFTTRSGVASGIGVHWGPRLLSPVFPAIVALGAVTFHRILEDRPIRSRVGLTALAGLTTLVAVLSSAQSIWFLAHQKFEAERLQDQIRAIPQEIVVCSIPVLPMHLASLWDEKKMMAVRDGSQLVELTRDLRAMKLEEFLLLVPAGSRVSESFAGCKFTRVLRHRGRKVHYLEVDGYVGSIR